MMDALNKLKVVELKKMLKGKGLSTEGSKANLVKRLYESGDKNLSDNEMSHENVDTDEDLILGHDDNSDTIETRKSGTASETKAAAASSVLTTAESNITAAKSPTNLTKISFPAEPQKGTETNGKMGERIKRFGVVSEDVKKKSRAERFQITSPASNEVSANNNTTNTSVTAADSVPKPTEATLKKRAERFGITESSTPVKSGQNDLLKKRAERFGASASETALPAKSEEKDVMLKRKARFSTSSDEGSTEAKKQKRAARFGTANS